MPKSLEDAIGCWTVNAEYNSLPTLARMVLETAKSCKRTTLKGNPANLATDLTILFNQVGVLQELTKDTIKRLNMIIETKELEK